MPGISLEEAVCQLEKVGIKVRRIGSEDRLCAIFPQGYYVAIGTGVAKELAEQIKGNPNLDCTAISNYFKACIWHNPEVARQILIK